MAWCRPGDKPLSDLMLIILLAHICVTRPQWVNSVSHECIYGAGNWVVFGLDNDTKPPAKQILMITYMRTMCD